MCSRGDFPPYDVPALAVAFAEDIATRCWRCGEPFKSGDERAEISDPASPGDTIVVHQACMKEGETVA